MCVNAIATSQYDVNDILLFFRFYTDTFGDTIGEKKLQSL